MGRLIVVLVGLASLSASQSTQTFTGVITDDMCAGVGHSQMRMGPTDAECVTACVAYHDSKYVLEDGKTVYALSDQRTPAAFAARKVQIVGTLDAGTRTIMVESIAAAN